MTKIKAKGNQLFNVPNNPDGQRFIAMMKDYRQPGVTFRIRKKKEEGTSTPFYSVHLRANSVLTHYKELVNKFIEDRNSKREQLLKAEKILTLQSNRINRSNKIIEEKEKEISILSARVKHYNELGFWGLIRLWRNK